eukprot:s1438_g5.t1
MFFLALSVFVSGASGLHVKMNHGQYNSPFWDDAQKFSLFSKAQFDARQACEVEVSSDLWNCLQNRVGEASNPGPLRVGTFNPHQLYNKEDVVCGWGPGLWAASETSHTVDAMQVSRSRFRKSGFHTAWSPPVQKHTRDAGLFRGRPSGTCLISHLRLKPYPAVPSCTAEHSSRVVEGIVDLGNGTNLFVASLYGPTHTTTFFDPWALLAAVCKESFDHALAFKGPAIIMGDMNVEICELPRWPALQRAGWIDCAAFDAERRGTCPGFTSKDRVRKTFILVNSQLAQALQWCDVVEEFEFDSHPLLAADFDLEIVHRPVSKFWLPVSTDRYMFDADLLEEHANSALSERQSKFDCAMASDDGDEAMRQFNLVFESCLQKSCVDSAGQHVRLPKRCIGRGTKAIRRNVRPSAPMIKPARDGEFTPCLCQPSLTIRYQTKQVRRLQSLESQLNASVRNGRDCPNDSCCQLWQSVLHARGFHPTFTDFVLKVFGIFVPLQCPGVEYVHYLVMVLKTHLQQEISETAKQLRFQRECRVLKDVQNGGPNAYRSVRDPSAPPFNAIERELQFPVVPQRWPKDGRQSLKLREPCTELDSQFPVYFQDQECFVQNIDGLRVQLDRKVKLKDPSQMKLVQKQVIADRQAMQKATGEAWSMLWQRDPKDDCPENWPEAFSFLQNMPAFPAMEFQPLQCSEWKRHAASVSKRSARGCCAYTPHELLVMPDTILQWLLQILQAIEHGRFSWPKALMTARVVMLGKSSERPTSPLQTRPITITSRIYRNWARYRSMQIIEHVKPLLAPQVAGAISGVSADLMAASLLLEVEKAVLSNHPRIGITIDLVKCFNAIPRQPVLAAMAKLGVPWQIIRALDSMFKQMHRLLELSGEVGDEWFSTTGVPEGCAMSIISMLSLSVWVAEHLKANVDSHTAVCLTFADNWALVTDTFSQLQTGVDALSKLVGSLRMKIAADKSWAWATHTKQRAALANLVLDGVSVPQKLVATELGCDVSYCKKVTKATTKKRLLKTSRVLKRVSSKRLPKRFKVTMSQQLSTGLSGYGSELVHHSAADLRLVRTAVCRAIGRSRAGNNPFLSTCVTRGLEDAAVTMLMRKVVFWRRYFKFFPAARHDFLANLATRRHLQGASAFLRRTFQDHGWTCHANGELVHTRGWKVNWIQASKAHLRKLLQLSWNLQVCSNVQHRTNFDAELVDVPAFHLALDKLDDSAKTDILNLATGKHVTNDALVHYARGTKDNVCPFCSQKDGRHHRVWKCKGTKKFRDKYPETMRWLKDQPKVVAEFGLLPADVSWIDWRYADASSIPDFPCPADSTDALVDVFTDGSALGQGLAGHTIAAAAYIRCDGSKVTARKAEPLPGCDHSAFRAEIWGVVMALRDHRRVHIFTDCASVVDNLTDIMVAKKAGLTPRFHDHDDLWGLVWRLVQGRDFCDVKVTKVKAHRDVTMVTNVTEKWMTVMNDKADKLAKACLKRTWHDCYEEVSSSIEARKCNIAMLHSFHVMWREMNEEALRLCKKESDQPDSSMPSFNVVLNPDNLVAIPCVVEQKDIDLCPYTSVFAQRVVQYFHHLQWDPEAPSVSCLELYVDFCLWTGTVAPCLLHVGARNSRGPVRSYVLPDMSPAADAVQATLREQSRVWSKVLAWLRDCCPTAPAKPIRGIRAFEHSSIRASVPMHPA